MTDSLALWNAEQQQEQNEILEWQESFLRNGLADFTPPMSSGLNCLMVGEDIDATRQQSQQSKSPKTFGNTKLPWESVPEADITSLRVITPTKKGTEKPSNAPYGKIKKRDANTASVDTVLVSERPRMETNNPTESSKIRVDSASIASVYDCFVDQGLMAAVLNDKDTVRELLLEAALALREHGIYVLVTQTLSDDTKVLLEEFSIEAGFEWNFELDGISNDASQVSVARRFNTGKMPKVGKLSRFQP
jgi:hypothetical protein